MTNEQPSAEIPGMIDLMHLLTERAAALDRSARAIVGGSGSFSTDELRWQMLEGSKAQQSLFKDLEWKTRQGEIAYDDLARLLQIILREVERFRMLLYNVNGFLTRDSATNPRRTRVRLSELLDEVIDLFEYAAKEKGVDIQKQLKGDPVLWVDRDLIERALVNLLDNALKYSFAPAEKGKRRFIEVSMRRHSADDKWLIAVKSYGVGILPEEIRDSRLFSYGVRGSLARDRERAGSGIGLAETKRIVEAHHGRLTIESIHLAEQVYLTIAEMILPARPLGR